MTLAWMKLRAASVASTERLSLIVVCPYKEGISNTARIRVQKVFISSPEIVKAGLCAIQQSRLWYLFGVRDAKRSKGTCSPVTKEISVPTLIASPTRVQAAGNLPKLIDEYVGRLNTLEERRSVGHMRSPAGWVEPGQTPEFLEYTVVLKGKLVVTHKEGSFEVKAGQAVISQD